MSRCTYHLYHGKNNYFHYDIMILTALKSMLILRVRCIISLRVDISYHPDTLSWRWTIQSFLLLERGAEFSNFIMVCFTHSETESTGVLYMWYNANNTPTKYFQLVEDLLFKLQMRHHAGSKWPMPIINGEMLVKVSVNLLFHFA